MLFSAADWVAVLVSALGIGGLVAGGERLRLLGVPGKVTRRLVHGGVCLFVAGAPWFFSSSGPLYLLACTFVLLNGWTRIRGWWPSIHAARPKSWGTVAVPLAVLPALAATWYVSPSRIPAFQAAFVVLGVADPLAASIGERCGTWHLTSSATIAGVATFAGVTALIVAVHQAVMGVPLPAVFAVVITTAAVAATVEAISQNGWDNLTVVLAVLTVMVPVSGDALVLWPMVGGLVVGVGFAGVAWMAGVLDGPGAGAGGLFAAALVGLGGPAWVVPGLAFFVLSSALTALPGRSDHEAASSAQRTLRQVLANGGVAWGLLLVFVFAPAEASSLRSACYAGFLGALAAAAADTWATEIGTRYAGRPVSLATGRRVPTGTSGAVSVVGTGAAVLGAATVVVAAYGVGRSALATPPVGGVVMAGLVGMALDSFAGAILQGYDPAAHVPTEFAERSTVEEAPSHGWRCIDDDVVNVLGTVGGACASVLFWVV